MSDFADFAVTSVVIRFKADGKEHELKFDAEHLPNSIFFNPTEARVLLRALGEEPKPIPPTELNAYLDGKRGKPTVPFRGSANFLLGHDGYCDWFRTWHGMERRSSK